MLCSKIIALEQSGNQCVVNHSEGLSEVVCAAVLFMLKLSLMKKSGGILSRKLQAYKRTQDYMSSDNSLGIGEPCAYLKII